jgi:hypothetical protein
MENVMENQILLHSEGFAFEDRKYNLRSFEQIITNYRQIIDHTVPLVLGQKILTSKIKKEITYRVSIDSGSLDILLEFIHQREDVIALFAIDGGYTLATAISKIIDSVINLRRIFTTILENNQKPKINIDNSISIDKSVEAHIETGDITINNPTIILAAENTKPPLDRLIRSIDGENVRFVDFKHENIITSIKEEDIRITGTQKEELSSQIEISGRLDMVAFSSHRGHIVTAGKRFPVTWDEEIRSKIQRFADTEGVVFRVRPIIDRRRFKDDPIAFHIINCRYPQTELDL